MLSNSQFLATAPLTILYEDADLLVVEKPAGLVVHPAYKHPSGSGTLSDYVFARQSERGESRPWLLHRLDRETSGAVLFAKTMAARRSLVRQFERRSIGKQYLALVVDRGGDGGLTDTGTIEAALRRDPLDRRRVIVAPEGQPATTRYRVLARRTGFALVLAEPQTGRTHQIRVHLSAQGSPIVGDARYLPDGDPAATLAARVMLHAWRLRLIRPGLGSPMTITAPLPADFRALADQLGLGATLTTLDELDNCATQA